MLEGNRFDRKIYVSDDGNLENLSPGEDPKEQTLIGLNLFGDPVPERNSKRPRRPGNKQSR